MKKYILIFLAAMALPLISNGQSSFIYESLRIQDRLDPMSTGRIVTTNKGDLIADNGIKTTVLSVGFNGQYLSADAAESVGLKWKTLVASDLSDFNTEVMNNSGVAANTTHRGLLNNPHSITKAQVGLSNVQDIKMNFISTGPPTMNDDSNAGYSVGSMWVDTNGQQAYICIIDSAGTALWKQITI